MRRPVTGTPSRPHGRGAVLGYADRRTQSAGEQLVHHASGRPRATTVRRLVAVVVAPLALLATLLTWSVATPLASSPDEDFHLASAWCGIGERPGLCETAADPAHRLVPLELLTAHRCFDHLPDQAATCPRQPSSVLVETDRGNFDGTYPPVFYAVMGVFASEHLSLSLVLMRMFNAALYVAMMLALFLLVPASRRAVVVWGGLVTLAPFGLFLIPSANPSSWGIISASTMWLAVLGYLESDRPGRRAGLAAIALISLLIGAGSRSDAAAFAVVAVVMAVILAANRTRPFLVSLWLPALITAAALATFLSSGQSNAVNPGTDISVPLDPTSATLTRLQLFWVNLIRLPELWAGAFGAPIATQSLWLGTTAAGIVWLPVILAFGGVVFGGLRVLGPRKAICLAMLIGLLVLLPMLWLMRDQIFVGQGVQSRYLYPLLIMLAMMSLVGLRGPNAGMTAVQLCCIAAAAWVSGVVVQWITLRRYVTGLDAHWLDLDSGIEWWWSPAVPIGPMAVWLIGAGSFAVLCAICVGFGSPGMRTRLFSAAADGVGAARGPGKPADSL